MVKIVFFDIDGTLVPFGSDAVPRSTRAALAQLHSKGIRTVIATGRMLSDMQKLPVMDLNMDAYLTLNGQVILDGSCRQLAACTLTADALRTALELLNRENIPFTMSGEKHRYVGNYHAFPVWMQDYISSPFLSAQDYRDEAVYQCTAFASGEVREQLRSALSDCKVVSWNDMGFDIIPGSGGKAAGIRLLLDMLGMKPDECMAFGDAENDMEMLRTAGIGVAMGNASETVKQAADYVTTASEEDGIVLALRHFGLLD